MRFHAKPIAFVVRNNLFNKDSNPITDPNPVGTVIDLVPHNAFWCLEIIHRFLKGTRYAKQKSEQEKSAAYGPRQETESPLGRGEQKLSKRSEVLQAAGARQNIGTAEDEEAARAFAASANNPKRPKAGR